MGSPCDTCIAGCCREYEVLPSGHDLFRIARGLSLPMADLVEWQAQRKQQGFFCILLSGGPPAERTYHRLVLRRVPDRRGSYTRRCMFLRTEHGAGRCGIYPVRPGVCRTYPLAFEGDVPRIAGGRHCPAPALSPAEGGAWDLDAMDVPLYRLHTGARNEQYLIYRQLIDEWNRRVLSRPVAHSQAAFLEYLEQAYEGLQRTPTLSSSTGRRL